MHAILRFAIISILLVATGRAAMAGEIVKVQINGLAFSPAEITIMPGDTVEWINHDFVDHTATAADESWDVTLAVGQTGQHEMSKVGTTKYFCRVHPNMTGIIHIVRE